MQRHSQEKHSHLGLIAAQTPAGAGFGCREIEMNTKSPAALECSSLRKQRHSLWGLIAAQTPAGAGFGQVEGDHSRAALECSSLRAFGGSLPRRHQQERSLAFFAEGASSSSTKHPLESCWICGAFDLKFNASRVA